ncbi:MAG: hypothetical protein A2Y88_06110 [Chloroflexi bacterium RBG_13_48_10]|nr:MAG: hypothetical protein A2Y88_06110 [Chloroflexi bacterium RBG_13_48_10]
MASLSFPKRIFFGLLRLFFKLLYHQLAWTYDGVAYIVSLGAWQKWVASIVPYLEGPKVLEIGFGPGHLQAALNQKEIFSFGVDESRQMAAIARQRLSKMGYPPNLVRGDAQLLPFADTCFNQVVTTFPAEFILNPSIFVEISRVLTDKGELIMLPLAWITGRSPLARLAAWVNRITDEAPKWDERFLEPLKSTGFELSWDILDFSTSKILLVRMRKSLLK